jgi:hypothetical protein
MQMAKALRGNRPPPRIRQPGERVRINAVIDPDLVVALDAAADHAGRARQREIEVRLKASIDFDAAFGGARAAAFFRGLASTVVAKFGEGGHWLDDAAKFIAVRDFMIRHLRSMELIPAPEYQAALVDVAINSFVSTRNPTWLQAAREIVADAQFPAERREAALAAIAEAETESPRRVTFRVAIPPDPVIPPDEQI